MEIAKAVGCSIGSESQWETATQEDDTLSKDVKSQGTCALLPHEIKQERDEEDEEEEREEAMVVVDAAAAASELAQQASSGTDLTTREAAGTHTPATCKVTLSRLPLSQAGSLLLPATKTRAPTRDLPRQPKASSVETEDAESPNAESEVVAVPTRSSLAGMRKARLPKRFLMYDLGKRRDEKAASPGEEERASSPGKVVAGKSPEKVVTGKSPEKVVIGKSPGKAIPGRSPGKVIPGRSPGKVIPGRSPGSEERGTDVRPLTPEDSGELTGLSHRRRHRKNFSTEDVALTAYRKHQLKKPLKLGWKRQIVVRSSIDGATKKKGDVYYVTPDGTKLRSKPSVLSYLRQKSIKTLNVNDFSFYYAVVLDDPNEEQRVTWGGAGRPKTESNEQQMNEQAQQRVQQETKEHPLVPLKRKRGRPSKASLAIRQIASGTMGQTLKYYPHLQTNAANANPAKLEIKTEDDDVQQLSPLKRKRGRPSKASLDMKGNGYSETQGTTSSSLQQQAGPVSKKVKLTLDEQPQRPQQQQQLQPKQKQSQSQPQKQQKQPQQQQQQQPQKQPQQQQQQQQQQQKQQQKQQQQQKPQQKQQKPQQKQQAKEDEEEEVPTAAGEEYMAKLMLKAAQVAGQTYDDPSDGPPLSKTNFIPGLTPNARPKLMLNPSLAVRPKPKLRLKPDPMPTSDPAPPPPPPRSPPVTVPTAKSYLPPAKLLQVKWKKPIKRGGGGGGGAFAQQVLNKKRAIIASPKKADMRGKVAEKFAEKVPRTQTLGRPVKNGALGKSVTLQEKGKSALRKKILSAQKKGGAAARQKKGITLSHTKYKGMNEAMKVKSRPVKDYGRKRLPLIAPNILEAHTHNQGFGDVYRPQGDVLCSLNCVGQEGIAPSLQCASCLCLFHPTCLGMIGHPTGPFLCTKCACIIAGTKPLGLDIGQHSAYPPGADTLSYSNSAMLDYATSWSYGRAPWEYAVPSWGPDAYHYAAPPNRQFPPPPPLKMAPHAVQASRGARSPPEEYMAAQRLFYAQSHGDASPRQPERGVALDITFTDVARKRSPVIAAMPVATGTTWQAPRKPGKRVLRRGAVDPGACVIQRLHAGLEVLPLIFRRLSFSDLMSASRVCRIWRGLIDTPTMWKTMVFRGCERFDWKAVTEVGRIYNTTHLDLKGLKNVPKIGYESPTTRWQHVLDAVQLLPSLKRITFGQVPAFVLERMADIPELADRLEVVSAEWIIDTVPSPEMWDIEAVMDVGKFGKLRSLQELTLRGLGGIRVAEESSCGGLKNLTCLKRLHTLSMTTLQEVPKEEFQFLAGMDSLVTLELGDCKTWNKETYAHLGQLSGLRHLRLEHGGTVPDTGLADAIANMTRLEHLELIMFTVADTLAGSLHQLRYLHTLTIWPDVQQPALVNTNVFNILSCLPKLEMLDWGVLCETNNNKDCEHDKNCETKDLPSGKPTEAPEVGTKVSEPAGRASRARRKRDKDAKDAGESGVPVGSMEEKSEVKVGEGNADEVRKSEDGYGSPIDETGAGESRKSVVRTDETGIVETIADDRGKDDRNVDDSSNDDNDPEENRNSEAKAIEGERDCAEDVKEDDGSVSEVSKSEENVIDAISKDERNVGYFRDSGDIVDATRNEVVNIHTTIKSGETNAGDATLGDLNENESVKDVANTDEKETDKTSLEQDGKVNASNSNASCVNNTGDIEADNANKDNSNTAETKIDTNTDEARKDKSVCATKPHGEDSSIDDKDAGEKRETRSTGKDSPGENQQTIHSPDGTALEKPPATGELKSVKQSASTIPFLPGAMYREGAHEQVQNSQTTEYLSVAQLMDSLCTILPETKIRILQIPMLDSAGAPSAERLD